MPQLGHMGAQLMGAARQRAQQNPGAGAQGNAPGQDGYYETNYTDVEDDPNKK